MEPFEIRRQFLNACSSGNLNQVKELLSKYKANDLEPVLDNSVAFEQAFRNGHIEIIDYILTNEKINQKLTIPSHTLNFLSDIDSKVIEYLCKNDTIKRHFNVLENEEHFTIALNAVCKKDNKELIKYLVCTPETEKFWKKKLSILNVLFSQNESDIGLINLVLDKVSLNKNSHGTKEKCFINMTLEDCLFRTLEKSNMELARYLVFDLNIKVEDYNREFIRERYPEGEKLLVLRELNENLNKELNQKEESNRKKPKV